MQSVSLFKCTKDSQISSHHVIGLKLNDPHTECDQIYSSPKYRLASL